ncbi:hypothetical protein F3J23_13975 [Chryseobacterium sp. Tr-659]|uniref:hypothetical protein n=1 Tax=Chryseobacterium sp. Tr-659 TaxID=2608340 RepID=UPI0014248B67|nr:hypothetical protein [Chryseobacterium sp. Tr-659]NIF06552.1 hypothetical protein [Chryseobacterium sp. Tr-659]
MKSFYFFFLFYFSFGFSQIQGLGINTHIPKGVLDLSTFDGSNSTMGLVLPRVDSIKSVTYIRDNHIAHGTVVYDLENNCPRVYLHHLQNWTQCFGGKNTVVSTSESAKENDCFIFNNVNYCLLKSSTGKLWLNKDLEDSAYYQWGRGSDGHQSPVSSVINLNPKPIPFISNNFTEFIINYNTDKNWIDPSFTNHSSLWDSNTISSYNPCPSGWKVPTEEDFSSLSIGDINKLFGFIANTRGIRQGDKEGTFSNNGYFLWTNTIDQADMSKAVKVSSGSILILPQRRDSGLRVRCLKK